MYEYALKEMNDTHRNINSGEAMGMLANLKYSTTTTVALFLKQIKDTPHTPAAFRTLNFREGERERRQTPATWVTPFRTEAHRGPRVSP